ncbi:MAG: RHS repeat-associated core domain-containing protein [Oscillospiraceae bacterium]
MIIHLDTFGETANNYLYCSAQFDSTTGLYYLRARYIDTSTGRFISMDTYQGSTADPVNNNEYKNVEMALLLLKILIKTIDSSIT